MQDIAASLLQAQEALTGEQADRLAVLFWRQTQGLIRHAQQQEDRHTAISLPQKKPTRRLPFEDHADKRGMAAAEIAERGAIRREQEILSQLTVE